MDTAALSADIGARIGAFDGLGADRPDHVLLRAAFLVGDDELVFVDDNLSRSLDDPGWNGDVVIFTAHRVIRLTLDHAIPPGSSHQEPSGEPTSSVAATAWGRADLRVLTVLGADAAWTAESTGTDEAAMPELTGLQLSYGGGQELEIPLRWSAGAGTTARAGVAALLPSLWGDLALWSDLAGGTP